MIFIPDTLKYMQVDPSHKVVNKLKKCVQKIKQDVKECGYAYCYNKQVINELGDEYEVLSKINCYLITKKGGER